MTLVTERTASRPSVVHPARRAVLAHRLELTAALVVGLGCLAARLVNIDRYSGSYPEGIRAEQLLLMAAGFRPFHDIFSDQGPWLLQTLYPGYALLGGTLAGVRSGVVVASLIGLAGVYWTVRQLAGPLGAFASVLLLALSPIYLQFSRLAVAEVLALAPAILAVACALRFAARPADRWLLLSAAGLAFSLLIKPITVGAIPAVAAAIWLAEGRRWRHLTLLGVATAGLVLVGVLLVGLPEILQQIVQFRAASRQAEGWSALANLRRFRTELGPEGLGLVLLAALGCVLAARRRAAWPLAIWALSSTALIFIHAPLHSKHFAVVVVPLAALAGYAVGLVVAEFSRGLGGTALAIQRVALAFGFLQVLLALPGIIASDGAILTSDDLFERDPAHRWYDDAAETLRWVVGADEYVVTDHAYLAYAARRLTPPALVEASATRVRAGSLTDAIAIEETRRYDSRAVLLWADKLDGLRRFRSWLTEGYVPIKVWAAEPDTRPMLWVPSDTRLDAARAELGRGLRPAPDEVTDGAWRLASYGLDRDAATPGQIISATLELESVADAAQDPRVQLSLVDSAGRVVDQELEPLVGTAKRPRWIFWVGALTVPRDAKVSSYDVQVALADARGRALSSPVRLGTIVCECG